MLTGKYLQDPNKDLEQLIKKIMTRKETTSARIGDLKKQNANRVINNVFKKSLKRSKALGENN